MLVQLILLTLLMESEIKGMEEPYITIHFLISCKSSKLEAGEMAKMATSP